eukprot:7587984-Lingulodinium_polyedra.AAC.1
MQDALRRGAREGPLLHNELPHQVARALRPLAHERALEAPVHRCVVAAPASPAVRPQGDAD